MISRKTVLIVGAGGSAPFGFPLHGELGENIKSILTTDYADYEDILAGYEWNATTAKDFGSVFDPRLRSIDEFLGDNPEYRELGAVAIALALIPCEMPETFGKGLDWYEALLKAMGPYEEDFRRSIDNLQIITFNYDRSLDYVLRQELRQIFDKEIQQPHSRREPYIIHIFGDLGRLGYENWVALCQAERCRLLEYSSRSVVASWPSPA